MAVVNGTDFQMFALWKEARDPFNPSHFSSGQRMHEPRDRGWTPLMEDNHVSNDYTFSLFLFRKKKYRINGKTLKSDFY